MRHLIANIATYTIAALLVIGAALFAWMRSSQLALTDEATILAQYRPEPGHDFRWQELGAMSYERNCATCHRRGGEGWDQYPPVSDAATLFLAPGGREFLIDMHLYGLTSDRWRAPMPPMGHIRDVELAAVINHVLTAFGNERTLPADALLVTPDEVARRRGQGLRPRDVEARRPGG